MKSVQVFLLLFFFSLLNVSKAFCQVKTYDAEWKRVDALLKERRLPQSALAEVKKIYTQAKKEGQEAQVIKALIYMTGLQEETREEAGTKAIAEIEKEIATTKAPASSILKSYLAHLYWQYYQNNRWRIYGRTATTSFNQKDIATWSSTDFHQKISTQFEQSLQPKPALQQTGLQRYEALIVKGNVRYLRPTLYDLLAHRALPYFKSGDRELARPAYAFEIKEPEAFAPAAQFVKATFPTRDTLSLQHKSLLLYQDLIRFHLNDKNAAALIDADLDRLQYVYSASVAENKDSLYVQALQAVTGQYNQTVAAEAWYLLAAYYEQQASTYQPTQDTTNRYVRIKAKEILERIVKDSALKTEAWANSYNLLQQLQNPYFTFEVEKVSVPDLPFRALVTYKNVQQLYFRLIRVNSNMKVLEQNQYEESYWNTLTATTPVRSWQQSLPATSDLQQHAVEIKVDALPAGRYILLASPNAAFSKQQSLLGAQQFYVSNISYIHNNQQFFVLHRQSGQPLAGTIANTYRQVYDYKTSRNARVPAGQYTTDKNGFFQIKDSFNKNNNPTLFVDLVYRGDSLEMKDGLYHYYQRGVEATKEEKRIFFFTDRSLYRPGQTVYFKGIVINEKGKEKAVAKGFASQLFLQDANGENADSLSVTTNDYGSFSGKFILRQSGLNGRFRIYDKRNGNEVSFSVEEYKRPKFYVQFDTLKSDFKLFDSVTVSGKANAYAGNTISGAQVAYRVVRQPRFFYPWLFKRGIFPRTQPMEIANGVTTTDDNGAFTVTFKAIPDLKIDKRLNPFFDYRLLADVTDVNGETRSTEQVITIGYQSLLLQVNIPAKISKDSLKTLSICTENTAGVYQPAAFNVTITTVQPEQRLIRSRYWQQPDQFVMKKQEFIQHFPYDEYADESDSKNWAKGATILQKRDSIPANGIWRLPQSLPAGFYQITVTTQDREGVEIKAVQYVEVYDEKKKDMLYPQYLWTAATSTTIEPGQKATVQIGTAADDVFLIQHQDKPGEKNGARSFSFENLQKEKETFSFGANETDRGGYGVHFFFVKHNRIHHYSEVIQVPWSNKDLQIHYTTFRDKTLPGSEEKWTVKITGTKNDLVAAEMLASMYDASLDQFQPHAWQKPGLWPMYAQPFHWNGQNNFTAVTSFQKWYNNNRHKSIVKQYDEWIFHQNNRYNIQIRGNASIDVREIQNERAMDAAAPTANKSITGSLQAQDMELDEAAVTGTGTQHPPPPPLPNISIRTNFNETAFFFPHLQTDKEGNIQFSFTTPEALTRWKLQTLAHTENLALGLGTKEMVTQKELMVQPNLPRFLRQGDRTELSVKIANLSGKELTGQVQLLLIDATTNQSVDGWFQNVFPNQYFTVAAGGSSAVKFPIEVPYLFNNALTWRIVARADNFTDGEEALLPVLTNRVLVTETLPLPMQGSGSKNFTFEKLKNTTSETLQHHALTVEYTANPAWLAVQALPYLTEGAKENAEQTWNRYYANALASMLVESAPRIKAVFEAWRKDSAALLSNLQKNESLKSLLLEETPWVLAAKTEAQQKQNLVLLFDAVRMSNELKNSVEKLKAMQKENGAFVWFNGGPEDRYMTQYIITGIGHLQHLYKAEKENEDLNAIVKNALLYLDKKVKEDYDALVKSKADLKKGQPSYLQVQYLYLRSFFADQKVAAVAQKAYDYYRRQAQLHWTTQNKYMQGMAALALYRTADLQTPKDIIRSLKETAIVNEELGMYWKGVGYGNSPYWWNAPIETQALLIEAFSEISKDTKTVDLLKTWLLRNKQTAHWRTSKATADACYALLLQGTNWLNSEPVVKVQLGSTVVSSTAEKAMDGTGYFTKTIGGTFVQPQMGTISVNVQQQNAASGPVNPPSWGAVYWQYFEDLDKITTAATPLQLSKKIFVQKRGDRGPVLQPLNEGDALKIGDKVTIRIELRADRAMEYVHMKDLRASALEPLDVLSGYQWKGGLGYYQTTKDAATHFYFHYLPKGTYVFEYNLFITHAGNFSNGITNIQSMYAPEFSAHSEGVRMNVEQ